MTNHELFAGSWYPQDPRELVALFGAPGERAELPKESPVLAVLPHAGLAYSGAGQGAFWHRWAERVRRQRPWDLVVIVSPSHYRPVPQGQTVGAPFDQFATPLGPLPGAPVNLGDREDAPLLEGEHGIELLLPGVRHFYGEGVPVAAVITGPLPTPESARAAARRVLERLQGHSAGRILWLVSSDFTHYGGRFGYTPYGDSADPATRETVRQDDLRVARGIAGADLPDFDPGLKPGLAGGFHYRGDASLRPDLLCSRWSERLRSQGGHLSRGVLAREGVPGRRSDRRPGDLARPTLG